MLFSISLTTNNNRSKRSFKQVKLKQYHMENEIGISTFSLFRSPILLFLTIYENMNWMFDPIKIVQVIHSIRKTKIILIGFDWNDIFIISFIFIFSSPSDFDDNFLPFDILNHCVTKHSTFHIILNWQIAVSRHSHSRIQRSIIIKGLWQRSFSTTIFYAIKANLFTCER